MGSNDMGVGVSHAQQFPLFRGAPLDWHWHPSGADAGRVVGSRPWDSSEFHDWGGVEDLEAALRGVIRNTSEHAFERLVFSHVPSGLPEWCPWLGYRGGVVTRGQALPNYSEEQLVLMTESFEIVSGGPGFGQCLILPRESVSFVEDRVGQLAQALSHLIWIANQVLIDGGALFAYSFVIRIGADGAVRYALYSPELDPMGALSHSLQILEGMALPFRCSPEETARRLRSAL